MGARGPRPTPLAVLQARGSWRGKIKRDHAQPPPGTPDCPDWLEEDAKAVWEALVPQLEHMRVLSRLDENALARYCQLWCRWRRAEAFIQKYGDTYPLKDDKGNVKCFMPFPQVTIAQKLAQTLTRMEAEFGMTPSSRSRIHVDHRPMAMTDQVAARRNWIDKFSQGTGRIGPPPPGC